jgi:hypothetical protein
MLRRLVALACLLAVVLSACGGSSATKQDVIARGNAICTDTLRAVRIAGNARGTGTSASGAALDAYVQRVVPIVEKEVAQLRKLPRPSANRALLDRYLAAVATAGRQYRWLAAAARRHDQAGVAEALGALRANPAPALARQYGLAQCAASAGTSGS